MLVLRRAQLKYLVRIFRRDISGHVCGSIDVSDLHYKSKKWTRSTGSSKGYSNKWILKKKQKTIKKKNQTKKKTKKNHQCKKVKQSRTTKSRAARSLTNTWKFVQVIGKGLSFSGLINDTRSWGLNKIIIGIDIVKLRTNIWSK